MRIAHVSDLHLLTQDDVPLSRFLNKRVTGLLNLKLKRNQKHRPGHLAAVLRRVRTWAPDHVVVTGDLTHVAWPAQVHELGIPKRPFRFIASWNGAWMIRWGGDTEDRYT